MTTFDDSRDNITRIEKMILAGDAASDRIGENVTRIDLAGDAEELDSDASLKYFSDKCECALCRDDDTSMDHEDISEDSVYVGSHWSHGLFGEKHFGGNGRTIRERREDW